MRRLLALPLLAIPGLVHAQGWRESAIIFAPHSTSYTLGSGASERMIAQTALPFVLVIPFTDRFSMDITAAYAVSDVIRGGASVSAIKGLTDTQLRANFSLTDQNLVFTAGVNLPTGQYTIPDAQQEAAGQIGNDFLNFPISSMGNGFGGTGGVAYARTLGTWNLGLGGSFRKSAEFSAFSVNNSDFRFQPADEFRFRVGLDRPVGEGQASFGLSYSAFGEDLADTTTYSTGDRIVATASWSFPVGGADLFLSGWNLYRMSGEQLGEAAPTENVLNLNASLSLDVKDIIVQPTVETRLWQSGGVRAGNMFNLGVRVRFGIGSFSLYPQVGYSFGTIYSTSDPSSSDVTGLRGSLTIRYR